MTFPDRSGTFFTVSKWYEGIVVDVSEQDSWDRWDGKTYKSLAAVDF